MSQPRKKISICAGTYNEEENIQEFYDRVMAILKKFPQYDYEFVIADNFSTDRTREIMREIAAVDHNFKCIFNARNFGAACSGYNALLQTSGDAVVSLCSDLQDPPEMIESFILKWEEGVPLVCAVKKNYGGNFILAGFRKMYYHLLKHFSELPLVEGFHGFGLYDRKVVDAMRQYSQPEPYVRGLISEIGFSKALLPYDQDKRKRGKSSYNFLRYYDYAMTGFVNHSKLPLRLAVFAGLFMSCISLLIALGYFIYKLLYWDTFKLGMAPLIIGLFFFSAIQLLFIGVIGEYLGAVWTQVKNKPLVIEEEKINFD